MKREEVILLGNSIIDAILNESFTPKSLFRSIAEYMPGSRSDNQKLFEAIWKKKSTTSKIMEYNQVLRITRGFDNSITTEEQLASYLPEEKILINKDIFRGHLDNVDMINIDQNKQKKIMDQLIVDSIGLTPNDVLLYYNLLKINQINDKSQKSTESRSTNSSTSSSDYGLEIYKLVVKNFLLSSANIKKINGGKVIDQAVAQKILTNGISTKRVNPQILSICVGHKNRKFFNYFYDFLSSISKQRGEDVTEILTYSAFYILFSGASESELKALNISSNIDAFLNGRMGRVKSIYYVAMLFLHNFNVVLTAQIYEISVKYLESPVEQRTKLEKLYSADNRRQLLVTNAVNIATRKISGYKNESIEVLNAFKRSQKSIKEFVTVADIFKNDYRSW